MIHGSISSCFDEGISSNLINPVLISLYSQVKKMSTIMHKEITDQVLISKRPSSTEYTEIISFLEQIRLFQIPEIFSSKSLTISFSDLRFENNS